MDLYDIKKSLIDMFAILHGKKIDYQQRLTEVLSSDEFKTIFKHEPNLELKILEGEVDEMEITSQRSESYGQEKTGHPNGAIFPVGSIGHVLARTSTYIDKTCNYSGDRYIQDYSLILTKDGLKQKICSEHRYAFARMDEGSENVLLRDLNSEKFYGQLYRGTAVLETDVKTISYWSIRSPRNVVHTIEKAVRCKLKNEDFEPRLVEPRFNNDIQYTDVDDPVCLRKGMVK